MAILKAVYVTFYTSDDDKRQESSLEMRLDDKSGNTVARAAGSYGRFETGTANGPFGLQVFGAAEKTHLSPGGVFVLSWTPWHGDTDQWHLAGMCADLVFDDSSHVFVTPGSFQMTAARTKAQFAVS